MGPTRFGALLLGATVVFVCLVGILAGRVQAEEPPPGLVWEARYDHSYSEDYARAVATDETGNVYVTGTGAGPNGSRDFVTLKYDSAGVLLWEAYYDYNYFNWDCFPNFIQGADAAQDIGVDGVGNVYVLGTTSYEYFCPVNHMYYVRDFAVVKYNPEGNRVWGFSRPIYDYAEGPTAMAVGHEGNVHIIGHHDWGDRGYVTRKYHSNGWPLWEANYLGSPSGNGYATDIAVDGPGNVYVTGRSEGEGSGYDYATVKYDPEGNEVWVARYDGWEGSDDRAEAIFVNSHGEVFVTGSAEGPGTGLDYTTIKYDPDGNEVWVARHEGWNGSADEAFSVTADDLGHVFVTGTAGGLWPDNDIVTVAYNSLGIRVWERRYDGPANGPDAGTSITVTALGDVVVTGNSEGTTSDDNYVAISYGSSSGAELWTARYDGPEHGDYAAPSLVADAEGDVVVIGSSHGVDTGPDYATVKYGPDGEELWSERFESPGSTRASSAPVAMALDPWGNICVTGEIDSSGYGTVKYDPDGNELWVAEYSNPDGWEYAYARDLAVDTEGNIHVTGYSEGAGTGKDYVTIKYDPTGSELWIARYNGTESAYDAATALAVDAVGNVYVTGVSEGTGTGGDYLTIKYDPAGNEIWTARYDSDAYTDEPHDLAVDVNGNTYVTGHSEVLGTDTDYATIKYDPAGNQLWIARYDGPGNDRDYPHALALDDSGNVYVTGYSEGSGTKRDYATIKYDPDGNEAWVARYDGPGHDSDYPSALVLDDSGNVYVTGRSSYDESDYGADTIKYDPDGNELWVARYSASRDNVSPIDISVDSSGYVYIAGTIEYVHSTYWQIRRFDYLTVKYDSEGNMAWEVFYDGPAIGIDDDGYDRLRAMVLDESGDIYVTGYSAPLGYGPWEMTTLRYTQAPACNDQDGDGYGLPDSRECTYPQRDCDDTDPGINPGNQEDDWEECHNLVDDDCDGFIDALATLLYPYGGQLGCFCDDLDGDGFGSGVGLEDPMWWAGCASPGMDCEGYDPEVYPNAPELCDYKDNQCPGDPGYGEIDEGCALTLVSPENGASLSDAPTFTWEAGLSDQFYLYLGIPVLGYGYLTFVVPTVEHGFVFPADTWQESITMRYWWSAWMVLGVDTSVDPPTWEASELRWFRKAK